jgi:hypothetical protein
MPTDLEARQRRFLLRSNRDGSAGQADCSIRLTPPVQRDSVIGI